MIIYVYNTYIYIFVWCIISLSLYIYYTDENPWSPCLKGPQHLINSQMTSLLGVDHPWLELTSPVISDITAWIPWQIFANKSNPMIFINNHTYIIYIYIASKYWIHIWIYHSFCFEQWLFFTLPASQMSRPGHSCDSCIPLVKIQVSKYLWGEQLRGWLATEVRAGFSDIA